ncbi:MFS transporter [Caballeronia sp. DA-9]|uniref:MFS transporter n=1 Tax=Caballeronia sp. DA-9 TaxID=3436237 RepID=UPI003F66740F
MNDGTSEFNRRSSGALFAAAIGVMVSAGPILGGSLGLFIVALGHDFGWSRTSISSVNVLTAVLAAFFTPILGRCLDKWGVRKVILGSVLFFALANMSVALVHANFWQFVALYGVIGVAAGMQNYVAYSKVVALWFERRRGVALACISTANGVGFILIPQLLRPTIERFGWRGGYICLGLLIIASLALLLPLLRAPSPNFEDDDCNPAALQVAGLETDLSVSQARRSAAFWLIGLMVLLGVTTIIGTLVHTVPMLIDRGWSPRFAATVQSCMAIGAIGGQLSYGVFVDRVDSPKIALPFFGASLLGMLLLDHSTTVPPLLAGGLLLGVAQGAELGLAAYFVSRYFGTRHLGQIYGLIYSGAFIGGGFGPALMGLAFDTTGSYRLAMALFEIALGIAVLSILLLKPYTFVARRTLSKRSQVQKANA